MKYVKSTFIILLTIALNTNYVCAQGQSVLRYKINHEFTGEVREEMDSVYSITCVIDRNALSKIRRLYVMMGSSPGSYDLFKLVLDSADFITGSEKQIDKVRKEKSKITIELGDYPAGPQYIEVWTREGKDNKEKKSIEEHKKAVRDDQLEIK